MLCVSVVALLVATVNGDLNVVITLYWLGVASTWFLF